MKSQCDKCGEIISDIDAGFLPGTHQMSHGCGGMWRVLSNDFNFDRDGRVAGWESQDNLEIICEECANENNSGDPITMAESGENKHCVYCHTRIS